MLFPVLLTTLFYVSINSGQLVTADDSGFEFGPPYKRSFNLTVDRSNSAESNGTIYFIIFGGLVTLFGLYFVYKLFGKKYRSNIPQVKFSNEISVVESGQSDSNDENWYPSRPLIATSNIREEERLLAALSAAKKLIATEYLEKGQLISEGNFGSVFKGKLRPGEISATEVAIKSLKLVGPENMLLFLDEAHKMKDFDHPNVMGLIGICFESETPVLVLPYMPNGDLLMFVTDPSKRIRLSILMNYCLDIANGMEYLSRKKCVHRDLAARNCMLDERFNAVVADFGLSKDVYSKGYYRGNNGTFLPFRWMAPESIKSFHFSCQSDVWSYAVTCWELISGGNCPYVTKYSYDLVQFFEDGGRLKRPFLCPEPVYRLWLRCWSYDPSQRPTFTQIAKEMREYISLHFQELEKNFLVPGNNYDVPRPSSQVQSGQMSQVENNAYFLQSGRFLPIESTYI